MEQRSEFEENCERYLLGELNEAERERFEESYFADDALFERFQAVKDDLLDAGARGELSADRQRRFSAHFLASAANRRQLEETRQLIGAATALAAKTVATGNGAVRSPRRDAVSAAAGAKSFGGFFNLRSFGWQAACAAVLLTALAGIWLIVRQRQPDPAALEAAGRPTPLPVNAAPTAQNNVVTANNDAAPTAPSPARVAQPPANPAQPPVETKPVTPALKKNSARLPQNPPPPERAENMPPIKERKITESDPALVAATDPETISSITLAPVAAREIGGENSLDIYRTTRTARVRLVFKDDGFRRYGVALSTVDGGVVWQARGLRANQRNGEKSVTVQLPADLLTKKDYIVTLKGQSAGQTETVAEYYFRVAHR